MDDKFAEIRRETEFLRQQLNVTRDDYSKAVDSLVLLAQGDTSVSRAAAQVLLSTYNGSNWHMDLTDLCVLDLNYLYKALIVIRGRVLLGREPHNVIENGSELFRDLEDQWQHFHTRNRYKDK